MSTRALARATGNGAPRTGVRLAFAGAVAVGAALATGELLAGLLPGMSSPLLAVARFIVDVQPPGAKDLVVGLFGDADKLAFQVFIVVVALSLGAGLGRLAPRSPAAAATVIAVFAGFGFAASLRDPQAGVALTAAGAAIQAVVGIWLLQRLVPIAGATPRPAATGTGAMPDWTRRSLLRTGGAIAVGSVALGSIGRYLLERQRAPATPSDVPVAPVPATLPSGADLATTDLSQAGLTPIVVPNDAFYRIDTAFIPPTVDRSTWSLTVKGMVDREVRLTYDELVALPVIEQYVTIACVSNVVGGKLVGNAKWTGVRLRDVLGMAGVRPDADQLVGESVDGFTAGMPVEWVMDASRTPMIAVAMNDAPLPRDHGYPARLIIPGLYGYVSATKWLASLTLTRFDQFDGFWVPLGWAQKAPILTQSRIDVPRNGASVPLGRVAVAGVAWAPDRGVSAVEVRVDGADWAPAKLSTPISNATWVQWLFEWNAAAGTHTLEVRATDGTGNVQTDERSSPAPDGARGHHTITVNVA
jgi:DMSO/TMAO reductase YedYZ molybdopterin-dependent catalytic subunit